MSLGSEFDGFADSVRFLEIWAKPPNEIIWDLRDLQNRTRNQDSAPKGPKISSYLRGTKQLAVSVEEFCGVDFGGGVF